jgi:hypothetical protein
MRGLVLLSRLEVFRRVVLGREAVALLHLFQKLYGLVKKVQCVDEDDTYCKSRSCLTPQLMGAGG